MNPTFAGSLPRNILGGEVLIRENLGFGLNFYKLLRFFISLLFVEFPDINPVVSDISGSSLPRDVSWPREVLIWLFV